MRKILFFLLLIVYGSLAAQENPNNRFLKIELSNDDYEILNLEDGIQYSIRTETDENNKFVIRVYNENNQQIAQYPGNAIIYPLFDEEAVLGPNTIIVAQETNDADLINLEDDLIVFRISDSTRNYKVGDILFGGISHESPYGYLRRLLTKEETDTSYIFQTEIAGLLESFDALSIHRLYDYETLVDEETGKTRFEQVGVNGIRTREMYNLGELFLSAEKQFLDSLITIEIGFKGTIQVEFVFKAKKFLGIPYGVDECKLVGHFGLDANMAFTNAAVSFDATIKVGEDKFPNITIPILGIPLVLTSKIVFNVKIHAEGGIKVKNNIFGKITTKTGFHYKKGLKPVMDATPNFGYTPPEVIGFYGNFGLSFGAELQVRPCSLDALMGYLSFYFGPELTIQTMAPQWKIDVKGKLAAGLKYDFGKFLGFSIQGGWEIPIWEPTIPWLSKEGNFITKEPSVATLPAYNITTSQATLKGEVTKKGISDVFERGFLWGLNTNALSNVIKVGSGLGIFEKQITDLQENKTYFYRAYAENYDGRTEGNINTISIPMLNPNINVPFNICTSSAMINAGFYRGVNSQTTTPDEYGFIWTTNSFPPLSEFDAYPNKMSVPVNNDTYSATIDGLDTNRQYYVASYIKYLGKTKISSHHTIKTLANENQCVTITIDDPTDVTSTSATFHVTVTGEPQVIEKGICYSFYNQIPNIEDLVVSHGSGAGDFIAILNDLQEATRYYVRPYAITEYGIFYGEVKRKTPCSPEYHPTSYRDANGTLFYTCVNRITTGGSRTLPSGWYSLSNEQLFDFTGSLTIDGTVHLILEDECDWRINGGIRVNSGNTLNIYAENEGTGKITTIGSAGMAGIRVLDGDTLIINGGNIIATGGNGGAGIGAGFVSLGYEGLSTGGKCGTITINGGIITAKGGNGGNGGNGKCAELLGTAEYGGYGGNGAGAGIGGSGGTSGGNCGPGSIGGGSSSVGGDGGTITINGGTVTADGGSNGSGGSGANDVFGCPLGKGEGGNGGGKGAGIGGGGGGGACGGTGSSANGAPGNSNGAIIGSGSSGGGNGGRSGGNGGTVIINGGSVNATGGTGAFMTIKNNNNQEVYRNILSTAPPKTNANVTAGMINEIPLADIPNAANGVYGIRDVKTDTNGKLYFYLPCSDTQNIHVTIGGVEYYASYPCTTNHNIEENLTGE